MRRSIALLLMLFNIILILKAQKRPGKAWVTVYAPAMISEDTLEVNVWDDIVFSEKIIPHRLYVATNNKGYFKFELDSIQDNSRLSLNLSYQKIDGIPRYGILDLYLLKPNDSLLIELFPCEGLIHTGRYFDSNIPLMVENWTAHFLGKGSVRYQARWDTDHLSNQKARMKLQKNHYSYDDENFEWMKWQIRFLDSLKICSISKLRSYESRLSHETVNVMKADIIGKFQEESLQLIRMLFAGIHVKMTDPNYAYLYRLFKDEVLFKEKEYSSEFLNSSIKSLGFTTYLHSEAELEYRFKYHNVKMTGLYTYVKNRFRNMAIRDRVLTALLLNRFNYNPSVSILEDVRRTIKDQFCIFSLSQLSNVLAGSKAYQFSLPDIHNKSHNFIDFKGKIVFMDFWYLACIPCRGYMKNELNPAIERFRTNDNVVFLSICLDDKETFQRALAQNDFLSAYAIHLFTNNKKFEHPILKHYGVTAFPFPILIDKQGNIKHVGSQLRDKKNIIELINKLL